MEAIKTISDLLPNPQVLNFHSKLPELPAWVGERNDLRLMMGAGDLCHGGIPNIRLFNTYNVFFCLPWNDHGSLRENVTYLLENCPQTLLCFVDNKNPDQVKMFTTLFAGRFSFIDGHGGHTPHLSPVDAQNVLADGGVATNMFEGSENLIHKHVLEGWLQLGYFKGGSGPDMITARLYGIVAEEEAGLRATLIAKMRELSAQNIQVKLPSTLDLDAMTFQELQFVTRGLLFEPFCPPNMVGSWVHMKKDWQRDAYRQFIFTKVPLDFGFVAVGSPVYARAQQIIAGIRTDLQSGFVMGSIMKYKTLRRVMATV